MGRFLVAHGEIGSNRFIEKDAFTSVGFSKLHRIVSYTNGTGGGIQNIIKNVNINVNGLFSGFDSFTRN